MNTQIQKDKTAELKPYLSPFAAWALSFGCSVGWGSFVMPATTFIPMAGPLGTAIGFGIGAVIMLILGMNFHYLINKYPDAGGTYSYAKNIFGTDHGFISSWFLGLSYIAILWANVNAIILISRTVVGGIFQVGFSYRIAGDTVYLGEILVCLMVIALVGLLCMGSRFVSAKVQILFALILILGISLVFAFAMAHQPENTQGMAPLFASGKGKALQIISVITLTPWAFVGYESISHSAGEFKFTTKKAFLIMALGVVAAAAAYLFLNFIAVSAVPPEYADWSSYFADLENLKGYLGIPTFYAAYRALGQAGSVVLSAAVIGGIVTGLVGSMIASSRLLFSMGKDGLLPEWFGKVSRYGTPDHAILFIMGISAVIPFLGRTAIGWIVDVTTIGVTVAYGFTSACAMVAAKNEKKKLYRGTGAVGLVLSVILFVLLLIPGLLTSNILEPETYLVLSVWSIIGLFFFRVRYTKNYSLHLGKSNIVMIVLVSMNVFCSSLWLLQQYEKGASGLLSLFVHLLLVLTALTLMFNIFTVIRKHELVVEKEKAEAEEGSRAKSRFLANMSHDIRTPMNAIIGYTELAKRESTTEEKRKEYLETIYSSGQNMLTILNDILEMSRIESGKVRLAPEPCDLLEMMHEIRNVFAGQMESKRLSFLVDCSEVRNNWVICDKLHLERILYNLLSNAYKFTDEGGFVQAVLRQVGDFGGVASFELRVKDTGIGMDPEFAKRVFEAFEQERTSTVSGLQGSGLGMAITKNLVELMDGTLDVDTSPGKGTEFTVNLEFAICESPDEYVSEQETLEETEEKPEFDGKRVLLVEDNQLNQEIAAHILKEAGFEVDFAENGMVAVEMVRTSASNLYDLVLMDIQMPVMNGYEATRAIRKLEDPLLSDVPIIALTANTFKEDVRASREAEMDGHIGKPYDVKVMMDTIRTIL